MPEPGGIPLRRFPVVAGSGGNTVLEQLYSMFQNLGKSVFGTGDDEAALRPLLEDAITRNLHQPIDAGVIRSIYGSSEEQLSRYADFDLAYRRAVRDELTSGVGINAARRAQLRNALNPNSEINLGLISSVRARRELQATFNIDVLKVGDLIKNARSSKHLSSNKQRNWKNYVHIFNKLKWWLRTDAGSFSERYI